MQYQEEDYLMISGIQHFEFCRRQWALIHIEQLWNENIYTIEGILMHKHAHNDVFTEKRGNTIITRGLPVQSSTLGVYGVCDVVEFIRDDKDGYEIYQREGKYQIASVEYKHGEPKENLEDIMQVVLQSMCLEEMLCCSINMGYIYYGKQKRRKEITITEQLRNRALQDVKEMHSYFERHYTPKVKTSAKCNSCSLKDLCLPKMMKQKSVAEYIAEMVG